MKYLFNIIFFIISFNYYSQEDKYIFPVKNNISENKDSSEQELLTYLIKKKKISKQAQNHVINRFKTESFSTLYCDSSKIALELKRTDSTSIIINIKIKIFNADLHNVKGNISEEEVKSIDGKRPFGSEYGLPSYLFESISIEFEGQEIAIPKNAYTNLYNFNKCQSFGFTKKIEAYISKDGNFVYLYIYGGNAASTYFSKLIFNNKKYLDRTILDYGDLSQFGSFHENFIGF